MQHQLLRLLHRLAHRAVAPRDSDAQLPQLYRHQLKHLPSNDQWIAVADNLLGAGERAEHKRDNWSIETARCSQWRFCTGEKTEAHPQAFDILLSRTGEINEGCVCGVIWMGNQPCRLRDSIPTGPVVVLLVVLVTRVFGALQLEA